MQSNCTITLRDNVRRLMDQHGWSQRKLAEASGLSQAGIGYLLRYKDGQDRHPTTETIDGLAKAFELDAWQLFVPNLPMTGLSLRHAANAKPPAPSMDSKLMAKCVVTAMEVFRAARRVPSDQQLAAATSFVYTHVTSGKRIKDAEKAVKDMLTRAGSGEPVFKP